MKEILAIILVFLIPRSLTHDHSRIFHYFVSGNESNDFIPELNPVLLVRYHNKVRREEGATNMMELVSLYVSNDWSVS